MIFVSYAFEMVWDRFMSDGMVKGYHFSFLFFSFFQPNEQCLRRTEIYLPFVHTYYVDRFEVRSWGSARLK